MLKIRIQETMIGTTPLHLAAINVENKNPGNNYGTTPFHLAVVCSHYYFLDSYFPHFQ
jgi:ankyrin repeat protein